MAYEEKGLELPHRLTMEGRARLNVTGITEIESFDENTVVLYTTQIGRASCRERVSWYV